MANASTGTGEDVVRNRTDGMQVVLTDGTHPDFHALIARLDDDLATRNGEAQATYSPFNKVDAIRDVALVYLEGCPVACGGFKEIETGVAEIKRMYVAPEQRRRGYARLILQTLQERARSKGFHALVLETGCRQFEAIALYESLGFVRIDHYGPYVGMEHSVCMRKALGTSD